jgi:hypothetical protein
VRALTTGCTHALALEQGYAPTQAVELRPGRKVQGVTDPVDLVVLAK